jgi:hypothetical protein
MVERFEVVADASRLCGCLCGCIIETSRCLLQRKVKRAL